jgi:hypothetical protein
MRPGVDSGHQSRTETRSALTKDLRPPPPDESEAPRVPEHEMTSPLMGTLWAPPEHHRAPEAQQDQQLVGAPRCLEVRPGVCGNEPNLDHESLPSWGALQCYAPWPLRARRPPPRKPTILSEVMKVSQVTPAHGASGLAAAAARGLVLDGRGPPA